MSAASKSPKVPSPLIDGRVKIGRHIPRIPYTTLLHDEGRSLFQGLDRGPVVVTGVLSPEEVATSQRRFEEALAFVKPNWATRPPGGGGGTTIHHCAGIPHCLEAQAVRSNAKVVRVWQVACGTERVVPSLDGMAISSPQEKHGASKLAVHLDQALNGPSKLLIEAYEAGVPTKYKAPLQSAVVLEDSLPCETDDADAKEELVPGGFLAATNVTVPLTENKDGKDWQVLTEAQLVEHKVRENLFFVPAPKGSMILWRSDTPHCNYKGDAGFFTRTAAGRRADRRFNRLALFVAMCPAEACNNLAALAARKKAMFLSEAAHAEAEADAKRAHVKEGRTARSWKPYVKPRSTTTHSPHVFVHNGRQFHYSTPKDPAKPGYCRPLPDEATALQPRMAALFDGNPLAAPDAK